MATANRCQSSKLRLRAGRGLKAAPLRDPDAFEVQVCHFEDHVVIGVVVQDAGASPVGDRGEQQLRGRKAMLPDTDELPLCLEGRPLDLFVHGKVGECEQLIEHRGMLVGVAGGVTGLEQERQGHRHTALLELVRDLSGRLSSKTPSEILTQAELSRSRVTIGPTVPLHVLSRLQVEWNHLSISDPIGQLVPELHLPILRHSHLSKLLPRTEGHELAEIDPLAVQLGAQLVVARRRVDEGDAVLRQP
jgi:hypothetical protein